jgi:hypothetical protein
VSRIDLDQCAATARIIKVYANYVFGGDILMPNAPIGELPASADEPPHESIPAMQRVLDNPFLLLFLGVTIPTVFYLIWGIMELAQIPIAP